MHLLAQLQAVVNPVRVDVLSLVQVVKHVVLAHLSSPSLWCGA